MMKKAALLATIFGVVQPSVQAFHTGFNLVPGKGSNQVTALRPSTPSASVVGAVTSPLHSTQLFSAAKDDASVSAESILDEFHQSNFPFRIVVIGNGAILETTSKLGPTAKSGISPKSGEKLLTFASEDKSFEFHVKVEQVCKIAFAATKFRVARFINENGTPICSLILADKSSEAEEWFDGLVEKHGNEVVM